METSFIRALGQLFVATFPTRYCTARAASAEIVCNLITIIAKSI